MDHFVLLLLKVIPLYVIILMGYLAGKYLNANRDTVAKILFFLITPVVIFNGVVNTQLDPNVLFVPVLTFLLSSVLCLTFYALSKPLWQDASRNLVAYSAGMGNTGYFGLPLALLLFDEHGGGVYIMAVLGITLYENSIGYYIVAKGSYTALECFFKIFKLPTFYAFLIGLAINFLHIPVPTLFTEFINHVKGTYTVLGMMIIGLGLSTLDSLKLDFKFIGMTFLAKFLVWPLLVLAIIAIDTHFFNFLDSSIYNALMLIAIVPLGANTVVLASLFKSKPEKAAAAVVLSAALALVYVPLMTTYFIEETHIDETIAEEEEEDMPLRIRRELHHP